MKKIRVLMLSILISINFSLKAESEVKVQTAEPVKIEVYRSPTCGCCSRWLDHLKKDQFEVIDHVTNDVQVIKDQYGVTQNIASCHTALVNGYVIEGHVPSTDIRKLLKLKPAIIGLSVPGMPVGTPGMEMGGKKDPYNVISFDKENKYKVFSHYEGK